jgi:A/G-specific adenine glycosylase
MHISINKIESFRRTVYSYFKKHKRDLPWRSNNDPYRIFISEVMLQQTQVDRVVQKYSFFIKELPDFKALAKAPLRKVFSLWQGLGYNRRAKALHDAAMQIIKQFDGRLPENPEELMTLPGIGPATAASIAAFAFNKPTLFLETNIRTVFIHHFFTGRGPVSDDEILPIAGAALDKRNPRKWYSALMDYGTYLKKEHGNATRQSTSYKKQPPFYGSRRQLRGQIMNLLIKENKMTRKKLFSSIDTPPERIGEAVGLLLKEQMIARNGEYFQVG